MLWSSRIRHVFQRYRVLCAVLVVLLTAATLWLVTYAIPYVIEQTKDSQCQSNMFQLATSLDNFKSLYDCFPPPFVSDEFGKPLYSWRALVIPLLDMSADGYDYTKPWNDPGNLTFANKGHNETFLENRFTCPSIQHAKPGQTDYFYVLSAEDRWPDDFFYEADARPKIVLVESHWRDVYWSEPVDFVYTKPKSEHAPIGQGFLEQLRKTHPPHSGGYNCVTSDSAYLKIPAEAGAMCPSDRLLLTFFRRPATGRDDEAGEKVKGLVAKLMKTLSDPRSRGTHWQGMALLLLGELGPRAGAAIPDIRRIMAEGDSNTSGIAALALAKIDK